MIVVLSGVLGYSNVRVIGAYGTQRAENVGYVGSWFPPTFRKAIRKSGDEKQRQIVKGGFDEALFASGSSFLNELFDSPRLFGIASRVNP